MIQFKANKGPTQITEVRQAIGYLLDRNEFVSKVVGTQEEGGADCGEKCEDHGHGKVLVCVPC